MEGVLESIGALREAAVRVAQSKFPEDVGNLSELITNSWPTIKRFDELVRKESERLHGGQQSRKFHQRR